MCMTLILENKDVVENISQLTDFLKCNPDDLIGKPYYPKVFPNQCLCQIDVEKTLDKFKIKYEHQGSYYQILEV